MCHGYLVFGCFGQRYAHGVAYAVGQQRTYSHGTLYAPLDAVARFGNAEMHGIIHPLRLHRLDQQPIGMYHDAGVARFHRHNRLVEMLLGADAQKLHRRSHHALRRIAPLVHDMACQRAVIYAYAQCHSALSALGNQLLQTAVVGTVIAGVDAHLIDIIGGNHGNLGYEMDVCHYGCRITVPAQTRYDFGEVLALFATLRRQPHYRRTRIGYALDLGNARCGIGGRGVGHRLYGNRTIASDFD